MEEINELFSEEDVADVVNEEGMRNIVNYVEYLQEALEVAVRWLHDVTNEEPEDIREIIASHVTIHNMEDIINKFEALSDIQEDLNKEE